MMIVNMWTSSSRLDVPWFGHASRTTVPGLDLFARLPRPVCRRFRSHPGTASNRYVLVPHFVLLFNLSSLSSLLFHFVHILPGRDYNERQLVWNAIRFELDFWNEMRVIPFHHFDDARRYLFRAYGKKEKREHRLDCHVNPDVFDEARV